MVVSCITDVKYRYILQKNMACAHQIRPKKSTNDLLLTLHNDGLHVRHHQTYACPHTTRNGSSGFSQFVVTAANVRDEQAHPL